MRYRKPRLPLATLLLALGIAAGWAASAPASTAAFAGTITETADCPPSHKDCLQQFTVKINYLDYISWGKFGRHTRLGETITRRVRTQGTACVINGRLTNARTLAKALAPGHWGYFYEDTWLNVFTTPDFRWGEVVNHDPTRRKFELRIHGTHKDHHIEANPPRTVTVSYDDQTTFQIEDKAGTAETALIVGSWVQVHEPRPQIMTVRTKDAAFDPKELLPQADGRRGYANNLTRPAVVRGYATEQPGGVIDIGVQLQVEELSPAGKDTDFTAVLDCRKVTFVLDGKPAPVEIAVAPGRRAVLCYYRKEKSPHKVFVESRQTSTRGKISSLAMKPVPSFTLVGDDGLPAGGRSPSPKIEIDTQAQNWLNGVKSTPAEALKPGREVVVHWARGRTIIAFPKNAAGLGRKRR